MKDATNDETSFTFLDALKEVCETKAQVARIVRCLRQAGILDEIELHHDALDKYSDESLLNIKNFGFISLIFTKRANALYKRKVKA